VLRKFLSFWEISFPLRCLSQWKHEPLLAGPAAACVVWILFFQVA
jgi:hypothetical protein